MLIHYERANVWSIYRAGGSPSVVGEPVVFMPGINTISESDWESIKTHPEVVRMLGSGFLKVVVDADPSHGASNELEMMNVEKATAAVEKTYDEALLEKWASVEKRKMVLKVIDKQLDRVKVKPPKTEPKDVKVE